MRACLEYHGLKMGQELEVNLISIVFGLVFLKLEKIPLREKHSLEIGKLVNIISSD